MADLLRARHQPPPRSSSLANLAKGESATELLGSDKFTAPKSYQSNKPSVPVEISHINGALPNGNGFDSHGAHEQQITAKSPTGEKQRTPASIEEVSDKYQMVFGRPRSASVFSEKELQGLLSTSQTSTKSPSNGYRRASSIASFRSSTSQKSIGDENPYEDEVNSLTQEEIRTILVENHTLRAEDHRLKAKVNDLEAKIITLNGQLAKCRNIALMLNNLVCE